MTYPFTEHGVLDFFDELGLDSRLDEGMRGHIEEQKVLFFRGTNALFHQVLGQALADVAQLISQLERVPRFPAQVLDPGLGRLRRLRLFDVAQSFVQQHVTRRRVGLANDPTRRQGSVTMRMRGTGKVAHENKDRIRWPDDNSV